MNPIVGLLCLVFFCQNIRLTTSNLGIPGTTQTTSGYDTGGKDPICWVSQSASSSSSSVTAGGNTTAPRVNEGIVFPNELVSDFTVSSVTLLRQCPDGVNLTVLAPAGLNSPGATPRIDTAYNYIVQGTLDLDTLRGRRVVSDDGDGRIALQILLCDVTAAGFCSPFVHDRFHARVQAAQEIQNASADATAGKENTHAHSEPIFLYLPRYNNNNETVLNFTVTVPLMPLAGGQYFTIGYAQFFTTDSLTGNASSVPLTRYDIANAASIPVVTFHPPPRIERVSLTVEIMVGIVVGLASLGILFMLYQTYIHRNNQIMKLSQGTFLMVLLVSALIGSISVVFINPKYDLYCQLFPPFAYIPCTVIYAVALARVWRAQTLLSPLLQEFYENRFTSYFNRLVDALAGMGDSGHLRRTVSDVRLVRVIVIFTTPELILQILGQVLQPRSTGVRFNEDESEGSAFCDHGVNEFLSFATWSFLSVLILNLILLVVAQASRKLPSLFNEVKGIVAMSAFNFGIVAVGYTVVRLSQSPGSSPSITFIVWGSVVLSITLNSSIRLVWPKLQMIWRGETVLVSKLVADQRITLRKGAHNKPSHVMDNVSGFTPQSGVDAVVERSNASNGDKENSNSRRRMEEPPVTLISQEEEEEDDDVYEDEKDREEDEEEDDESSIDEVDEEAFHRKWSSRGRLPEKGLSARGSESGRRPASSTVSSQIRRRKGHSSRRSLVSEDRPPSRSLLVPMLELQELLTSINSRVTSGLTVSRPDWEDLRELATRLGGKFTENDIFQWENQEREPNGHVVDADEVV